MVQVSLTVLFFSILMVVFLTPRLAWDKYNNARKEKFYAKLRNRYGDILLKIFADKHNYTDEEVLELVNGKPSEKGYYVDENAKTDSRSHAKYPWRE